MDFASIIIFLILYYIRPQEWIPSFANLQPIKILMVFAVASLFMRPQGVKAKDFLKTPHDWLMLAYFLWIVGTAPVPRETFSACNNLFLFYILTVQALSSFERIQKFLDWWTVMIMVICLLAAVAPVFDPMGSDYVTQGPMRGRMVLNTSMFNNPNAFGHSITPVVVMLYFVLYWERPAFLRVIAIPLAILPLFCLYKTISKGAYIACFFTVVMAMTFRRPKWMQILIIAFALTTGWAGMTQLPRMNELENAKSEGGIKGRLIAFQYGLNLMRQNTTGVGYEKFAERFLKSHGYYKATHSCYVQVGSELGWTGLALFVGLIYWCFRTLILAKTDTIEQERIRRILFTLVAAYTISSWMVNISYRATFFLMVAAVAAFDRRLRESKQAIELKTEEEQAAAATLTPAMALGAWHLAPVPAAPGILPGNAQQIFPTPTIDVPGTVLETEAEPAKRPWNKKLVLALDIAAIYGLTEFTVFFWQYIMKHL